ncbi:hypothetical protein ACOMHN_039467 [Nucella lapillus]
MENFRRKSLDIIRRKSLDGQRRKSTDSVKKGGGGGGTCTVGFRVDGQYLYPGYDDGLYRHPAHNSYYPTLSSTDPGDFTLAVPLFDGQRSPKAILR